MNKFTNFDILIKDLPPKYFFLAIKYCQDINIAVVDAFTWGSTKEGLIFWGYTACGNFTEANKIYKW